jgi:uncharacterized phage protein gp47/JayE
MTTIVKPDRDALIVDIENTIEGTLSGVGELADFVAEYADALLTLWEEAAEIERAWVREEIVEWAVEALAGLFGVARLQESHSEVVVVITGDPGVVVQSGSRVEAIEPIGGAEAEELLLEEPELSAADAFDSIVAKRAARSEWVTQDTVTLERLPEWEASQDVDAGYRFSTNANVWEVVTAGTLPSSQTFGSAYQGPMTGSGGTAVIRAIGQGRGLAEARCRAAGSGRVSEPAGAFARLDSVNGDIDALAEGITRIKTPVDGWRAVLNPESVNIGRATETAVELLARALTSQNHDTPNQTGRTTTTPSTDPLRGVEAALARVTGVIASRVYDVAGNIHALVLGGADADVAETLYVLLPAGVRSAGSGDGTQIAEKVKRPDGKYKTIVFDRPDPVEVSIELSIAVESASFAGEDAVTEAVETLSLDRTERPIKERLGLGVDVAADRIGCAVLKVPGVTNVFTRVDGGSSASIEMHEYATFVVTMEIFE